MKIALITDTHVGASHSPIILVNFTITFFFLILKNIILKHVFIWEMLLIEENILISKLLMI